MLGTAKTVNHQNLRNCLYAVIKRLPHKVCRILAARSLADTTYHCHHRRHHHHRLPYLEAQA